MFTFYSIDKKEREREKGKKRQTIKQIEKNKGTHTCIYQYIYYN